ncbi:hypothetical protein HZ326_14956 [Fusarium oxysporum f. sp. albedinis]|nr:hypothetical protein HZ326_14956 [Fusarium oxysporum f. sp. albedinis]
MKGFAPRGFWLPSQIVGLAREGSVLHVLQPRSECATVCKCMHELAYATLLELMCEVQMLGKHQAASGKVHNFGDRPATR